jgi:oxaloacetate decarboxylase (Na+ extruding) subunit alpha
MNLERIEALLRLLQQQGTVGEMEVEGDGWRLRARRSPHVLFVPEPDTAAGAEADAAAENHVIRAPMVGVYRAPEAPLHLRDRMEPGAPVGSIEAMRILNPVVVEAEGYLAEILIEDGDPVEFGQELFIVSPELVPQE